MRGFSGRVLRLLLVVGVTLGAAAGAAYAVSAHTTSTTTINACKGPFGLLRIVNDPGDCRHNESLISWNVQGPKGDPGPAGAAGPAGAKGAKGDTGATGPKGDTGATGPQGLIGLTGATGPAGPMGVDGPMGPIGPAGPIGLPGVQGVPGAVGPAGPGGANGPAGPAGAAGPAGPAGAAGAQGPKGDKGDTGPQGPAGPDPRFGTDTSLANSGGAVGHGETCTLGEIMLTAGVVANGLPARGQLLPINQEQALFALLGTTYGGNGITNFQIPDLRGAAPNGLTYTICVAGVFPSQN